VSKGTRRGRTKKLKKFQTSVKNSFYGQRL